MTISKINPKKIFVILLSTIAISFSCNNTQKENKPKLFGNPKIKFSETDINLGKLNAGEIAEHTFKVTNTGTNTLVITNIETDCGCTVPVVQNKIIEPKQTQKITVTFNSSGFSGNIFKTVTVYSNSPEKETILNISAFVVNTEIINNY